MLYVGYISQNFLAKFCVNEFTYFGITLLRITYSVYIYIYIYSEIGWNNLNNITFKRKGTFKMKLNNN